jgi:hypothetical protein
MTNDPTTFDSREQYLALASDLIRTAKRQCCFFAPTLDVVLLDNASVIESLSSPARSSEKARIRLLIHDSQPSVARGHRLLSLAQKLSSSIAIHKTAAQHREANQLFLIVDDRAHLYCPHHSLYQGRKNDNDAAETRQLQQVFDTMWEQSSIDSSLRRLHI